MRRGFVCVVLALSLAGVGCGGGSSGDILQELQDCGVGAVLNVLSVVDYLGDVLDEIEDLDGPVIVGNLDPDVVVTETGENTYQFTINLDLNGDRVNETTITGTWSFDRDVSDGVPTGTVSTLTVSTTTSPTVSATGLEITFLSRNRVSLVGVVNVVGGGCDATLTMTEANPLEIEFNDFEDEARLSVNIANYLFVTGSLTADIAIGGSDLLTTMVFSAFSNFVDFTNNELNGEMIDDDSVEAFLSETEFQDVQGCVIGHLFALLALAELVEEVIDAVRDGETTIEDGEFTLTPNPPGSVTDFDLVVTVNQGGSTATLNARVLFSSDPTAGLSFTGSVDVPTWDFTFTQGMLTGVPFFFFGSFRGESTSAARITIDEDNLDTFYGGGRFTTLDEFGQDDDFCAGTATIPASNPIRAGDSILSGIVPPLGKVVIDLTVDEIDVKLTFVLDDDELDIDELLVIEAEVDGIPVPGNLLENILFLIF